METNKVDYEGLFNKLVNSTEYRLDTLTKRKIENSIGSTELTGLYIFYDNGKAMYVGITQHLAQKIAKDERAENESTIVKKVLKQLDLSSLKEAREYVRNNYTVRYLVINDIRVTEKLAKYTANKLSTEFNNFL